MHLEKPLLEDWMRTFYFQTRYDLGSSGVKNFSINELINLTGLSLESISNVRFNDSETFGSIELRQNIADRWGNGDYNTVMVGNGSNEVIFLLLTSLISENDEVIILEPLYHTLGKLAGSLSRNIKVWTLDPSDNFKPNLDKLEKLITLKTRAVIVNFPHNPTGVSLSRSELDRLIDMVAKVDAYLVWDAALQDLVFQGSPLPNPFLFYNKTIYIGTGSKCYGLAGLRLGWCIALPEVINRCDNMKDYTSLYVSPLIDLIGTHCIKNMDKLLGYIRPSIKNNFQTLLSWMNSNKDKISGALPHGGVTTFVKLLKFDNSLQFCQNIAEKKKILLVPGECFGQTGFVRLGFGAASQEFEEGLSILAQEI